MTNQELNRDIKRLWNVRELHKQDHDNYYDFVTNEGKNEFIRLYFADKNGESLNLMSLKIMHRLNQIHRYIPFHMFYINMNI